MSGPSSWNQTAAAETTASANMSSPIPSRRCSGSRSRAPWPMPRATAPMPWATASQSAAAPLKTPSKKLATGPRPLRTARGAGRLLLVAPLPRAGLRPGLRFLLDAVRLRLRVLLARASEDVLLLREPGGEDVRVATPPTLCNRHSSHTHHRDACRAARRGARPAAEPL